MADAELAAGDELATPAIGTEQQIETPEPETDEVEGEEGQSGDEPAIDEDEDFEADDGTTYRVPKSLVPLLMRNKDYTQKSQANAELSRTLAAKESQVEERLKATDEELDARAQHRNVLTELERFKDYTFATYQANRQQDPMQADEAWAYSQHLRNQKAELETKIGAAQQARSQAFADDFAKRAEDTRQFAQTKIKGWNAELDAKLQTFVKDKGIAQNFVLRNMNPALYELIYEAYIGKQTLQKQTAPKAPTPPPPAPLKIVRGKGTIPPTGLDDRLSTDEWMKRREAQVRKQARRG